MKPKIERAIVVGASSGIGEALVRQLAAAGVHVAAIARRKDRLEALAVPFPDLVIPISADVADFEQTPRVFEEATRRLGGLDLIIYCAGIMPTVGPTEYNFEKDREMIAVNLLGAMAWLDLAAVRFSATKSGTIVGIGSVAGDRGRSGQPAYNTSKAALATYLEALRNRLDKIGVVVSTIKPGPVATDMTKRAGLSPSMGPDEAARIILSKGLRPGEHYLKFTHRIAFAIIRLIPSWLFRRLSI